MPHLCPRPCGRLATAAVFVSVGVVQFIAGLILLKSKYVYLLAAPDFWTSASNLAVGSLLGISASVWQNIQKASFKHAARRNILAALVFTSILMNLTTTVILIMGEGNALLSINLENDGRYSSATLASEILAYSYATSVCSPIVCIVIAIAFLSGIWFRKKDKEEKTVEFKSISKRNSFDDYNWVFKEKQSFLNQDPQIIQKTFSFKSLSSSSDEESSSSTNSTLRDDSGLPVSPISKGIRRIRKLVPENVISPKLPCECGEHLGDISNISAYETNHVSSVGDSERTLKHQKDLSFSSRRHSHHSGQYAEIHPVDSCKDDSSLSYTDFKSNHQRLVHFKLFPEIKRMPLEHPSSQNTKFTCRNERIHSLQSPSPKHCSIQSQSPRISKPEPPTQSLVVAEVHMDPRSCDNPNLYRIKVPLEEETLFYDDNISCEVHDGSAENICNKHTSFQRSSSYISLKDPNIFNSEDRMPERSFIKVRRTSTTTLNSSRISSLEISNIETGSIINPSHCHDHNETEKIGLHHSFHGEDLDVSQIDSTIGVDDTFFDAPASKNLAGEVVPVKVGSISRKPVHHKLIPVTIPVVSSAKKNPLVNTRKGDVASNGTDKIIGRRNVNFSSFRREIKTESKDCHCKSRDEELLSHSKKDCEAFEPFMNSTTEALEETLPVSPTHTSGYDSAFDETAQASHSSNFRLNSSSLSLSDIDEDCSFLTPKKKRNNDLSSKPLANKRESPEPMAEDLVQIVNRIINRTSISRKKELIAQLLNDVSTQKVTSDEKL